MYVRLWFYDRNKTLSYCNPLDVLKRSVSRLMFILNHMYPKDF